MRKILMWSLVVILVLGLGGWSVHRFVLKAPEQKVEAEPSPTVPKPPMLRPVPKQGMITPHEKGGISRPQGGWREGRGLGNDLGRWLIPARDLVASDLMAPYKPGILAKLKADKTPAFLHFTGDACLLCKYEWSRVDQKKLADAALKHGIILYEYSIDSNWGQVLKELVPEGIFGVPGYLFVDSNGQVSKLDSVSSADDIILKFSLISGEKK
jgi:hypothetical protein